MPKKRTKVGDDFGKIDVIEMSPGSGDDGELLEEERSFEFPDDDSLTLEGNLSELEHQAREILTEFNLSEDDRDPTKYEYPHPVWFSFEMIDKIEMVRLQVAAELPEDAALCALHLGYITKEVEAREEYPKVIRKHSSRNATDVLYADSRKEKELFAEQYRDVRRIIPDSGRKVMIEKVYEGRDIPDKSISWAKEIDRKDDFKQPVGRPRSEK